MPGTTDNGIPYPLGSENNSAVGAMAALAEFIDSRIHHTGDLKVTLDAGTVPNGWLAFGQTVEDGDDLYPELWSKLPSSYKVGNDIVLPDPTDSTLSFVLTGALGGVTGLNTVTLATTNLPSHNHSLNNHTHTINHSHTASSGTQSASHTHSGSTLSTSTTGAHDHNVGSGAQLIFSSTGGIAEIPLSGSPNVHSTGGWATTGGDGGNHSHSVSGSTGPQSASHSHSITVNAFNGASGAATGDTGTTGAATPVNIKSKAVVARLLIKT